MHPHPHNTSPSALAYYTLTALLTLPLTTLPTNHSPLLTNLLTTSLTNPSPLLTTPTPTPQVSSKLSPTEMQRVGRIAHRMASEGYEPPAINLVVRVLPRLLARNPMHPNCNPVH